VHTVFYTLALGGIGAAAAGIVVNAVRAFRERDADVFTTSIPWGYAGVGLALAGAGFWVTRLLADRSLPHVDDPWGFFIVLVVASAGYGMAKDLFDRRTALPWPLVLSAVLGVAGGLSSVAV